MTTGLIVKGPIVTVVKRSIKAVALPAALSFDVPLI